eukprot:evm.model.scf_430.6 EVM.evm.TU.scf_430.6   scf_430:45203-49543(-)
MAKDDKAKEGAQALKKAERKTRVSVLRGRLRPDWEAACPLFERAGNLLRQAKDPEGAKYAFERAAQAQEQLGSPWHAARHLEAAAELSRQLGSVEATAQLYEQAAALCLGAGRHEAGAEEYTKGAKAIQDREPQWAAEMYHKALDVLETEEKWSQSIDVFRGAVALDVQREEWDSAEGLLMRQAHACERAHAITSQCRAYVGSIVLGLYCGEAAQAWAVYQDVMVIPSFVKSEEASAVQELLAAYRSRSADAVRACVAKRAVFQHLDTAVGRLAAKLPTGDVEEMGRHLHSLGWQEGDEEEDLDIT